MLHPPPRHRYVPTRAACTCRRRLHLPPPLARHAHAQDPHTLLVADTPLGRALADQIAAAVPSQPDQTAIKPDQAPQPQPPQPQQPYLALEFVPDTIAANVLSLNEHVVTQAGHPASQARIAELCAARGLTLHTLGMAELAKADGALTCCSLLFKGPPGRMEETEEGKQGR